MTNPANSHKNENTFGSFALGVAVGVGAALFFGTDEGKKIANRLFDALPEKVKNLTDDTSSLRVSPTGEPKQSPSYLSLQEPESTPHSYIYSEPPPPPAPHVTPTPPSLRVS